MADDGVTINLTGDRDIVAAFKDLREYMPKNAIRSALRQASQMLAQYVALAAPKLTGNLARNIVVKTKKTASTIRSRVTVNTRGDVKGGQNAFYWRFLEEGFHTRSGEYKKYPFIAGVFDSKSREASQAVIDACEKAITRAEAKAKRS